MRAYRIFVSIILFIFNVSVVLANSEIIDRTLSWNGIKKIELGPSNSYYMLHFAGSLNEPSDDFLPRFYENFRMSDRTSSINATIKHAIYEPLSAAELSVLQGLDKIETEIIPESFIGYESGNPIASISFIPLRKNPVTGQVEKLVQFSILINSSLSTSPLLKSGNYASNSVLATGNWYKIAVSKTGIYKLSYQNLADLGMSVGNLNPKHLRIYGMPGGMLPESLDVPRADDLQEFSIYVEGESDGVFGASDYILFYGEGPNTVNYDPNRQILKSQVHLYSDYTYYFITADLGEGKRIASDTPPAGDPNNFVNTYNDFIHYEQEDNNLIGSGRQWYGEKFDLYTEISREFNIQGIETNEKMTFTAAAAARSDISSSFGFYINNTKILQLAIQNTNSSNPNSDFAKARTDSSQFYPPSENISLKIVYNKTLNSSVGYLDYFNMNFTRDLSFASGQMAFRSFSTISTEAITKYTLSKANDNVIIWNVTDPVSVKSIETDYSNTKLEFIHASSSLQEFVAFDGSSFYTPENLGSVANQNLHALDNFDYVILTHPDFKSEAQRLADFHVEESNMNVLVVEPQLIYNEFSSGSQDITAIRDFLKMLYDRRSPAAPPIYLLLFGDASYDFKNREENNTNFIPSWQSPESLNPVGSYVKDDFYGLLDGGGDSFVDLSIGRFVVSSAEQAKTAVDKVLHYAVHKPAVMGDWRNIICLMADDEDSNLHFGDAEELADSISSLMPEINIDKIYLDAYPQVSTPSGERYPDANLDLNNRINRGALIVNYVGHGGEGGLAHERVVEIADINSWDNFDNMPVFITATCEFSRFDDPGRTSAGEYVFLSSKGAGVALFTTTRATYAGANMQLNKNFYKYALERVNGQYHRMGDVIRLAKNASGSVENKSKFSLLGDPALKFAFPEHNVISSMITNTEKEIIDTIQALLKVTISGEIQDFDGNKLDGFNGTLYPTVFDKPSRYSTLANDPASFPNEFRIQKNALYKGKANITNGEWSFTFIAPKDIAYQFGFGKLSFYARNENIDGNGCFNSVVIGGYNQNAVADNQGPEINLFMNDFNFTFGGLTDENPKLLAEIFDESGINTVGSGIGHDLIVTLDDDKTYIINDYYEAGLNDYKNGNVRYPFYDLSNGRHTLTLRAWDIYNNSSVATTEFIVAESGEMALINLMNYPNPFKAGTHFTFEHNQAEQPLEVSLQIFALNGQLVKSLDDFYQADGYKYKSPVWDGRGEDGNKLQGMFVYRLTLQNQDGSVVEETNKLVILK
ncbi:MAG: type IX secretion system sortase PorU [Bacteroidetes bacterium]|nr:type IX secretion system sortase PorU [Bacteroidota bacterium]